MSGTIHLYPDGHMYITTDEAPSQESIEMITRTIRDRGTLVLGKGWDLVHEGADFGMDGPLRANPVQPTEGLGNVANAVLFGFVTGAFGFMAGLLVGAFVR